MELAPPLRIGGSRQTKMFGHGIDGGNGRPAVIERLSSRIHHSAVTARSTTKGAPRGHRSDPGQIFGGRTGPEPWR